MKNVCIDHFISLLQRCKQEGCNEIIFEIEPKTKDGVEYNLIMMQSDRSLIISTKKSIS